MATCGLCLPNRSPTKTIYYAFVGSILGSSRPKSNLKVSQYLSHIYYWKDDIIDDKLIEMSMRPIRMDFIVKSMLPKILYEQY